MLLKKRQLKANQNRQPHAYILTGGILVALVLMLALLAPLLTTYDPLDMMPRNRLLPPSSQHLLGTDEFGRDVLSRVLYGARASVQIGLAVVFVTIISGTLVGMLAGYYKGLDNLLMRILDGLMAFPEIIIAITLAAIWGSGMTNIIFAMSFAYFPRMARVVRGSVMASRELEYVEAARALGGRNTYIMARHILPNCLSPILVQATFCFASAILAEAALSYLGVGIKEPTPSWGGMISQGRDFMSVAPWLVNVPGVAIILSVLGLNLLGDGLRDFFDPRLKQ